MYRIPTLFSPPKTNTVLLTPGAHTLAGLCPSTQPRVRARRTCVVLFALTDVAPSYPAGPLDARTGLGQRADCNRLAASARLPAHRQAHRAHPGRPRLTRPPERAEARPARRLGRRAVQGGDHGVAEGGRGCFWRARCLGTRGWFLVVLGSGTPLYSILESR